ncbi:MAG: TRAP transporter large permease [Eubacteriales bacterium]|jgi:tripartite ATP-independent transporter DctM subunit
MAVIFLPFVVLLLAGMPIGFTIFISCMCYLMANDMTCTIAVQRMAAGVDSFPLLAIPFFILAGVVMNNGGVTTRIFNLCNVLVGHITGGLGHANVLASVIFAGMSGSALADAGGLGAIELAAMKEAGYEDDFSLAITGASSIIGPIIPPSIAAVMFAVAANVSLGRLLIAGILPGIVLAFSMCCVVYVQCKKKGYQKRARPTLREIWEAFSQAFLPLMTPVILIGGILGGVFTPTEAAVVAVAYAIILGLFYKTITWKDMYGYLVETARVTTNVMMMVAAASLFGWIMARAGVANLISNFFLNFISNKVSALLVLNVFLLVVGMLLDNSAAIPILAPVLMPVALQYGIDPIHFGIIMIVNLMIGLLTPPVGGVLFVLQSISSVPYEKLVKALVPYLLVTIVVLYILTFVPQISLILPNLLMPV